MCFRPAEISMNMCPACGAANKPIAKECAKCGAALGVMKVDMDADQASLDAANMFGAPSMPGMPQSPTAPAMPQMPTAPAAPSAPVAPQAPQA